MQIMKELGFARSLCDPCVYWKHTKLGLIVWISWIDDMLCIGHPNEVKRSKKEFMDKIECDDFGEFNEYVGCKIERNEGTMKFTQPVLLQSFKDEFNLPKYKFDTPAEAGQVIGGVKEGEGVSEEEQSKFRSGVGKLLHMMRWSRPEIWNAVRECSTRMTKCNP